MDQTDVFGLTVSSQNSARHCEHLQSSWAVLCRGILLVLYLQITLLKITNWPMFTKNLTPDRLEEEAKRAVHRRNLLVRV